MPDPLAEYIIKPHALMEMGRRLITLDQVARALAGHGQILDVRPGRKIYQDRIAVGGKEYLLRVVVDVDRLPAEIVTIYRTSKTAKYWRKTDEGDI
ncbi:MAG: DUF4258 domain-containing protein [Chloroflexi bacterium]|nr:DUF4258 domain-containing protein [Chloroflexota bacterium]